MYVIIVYDVDVDKNRTVLTFLRTRLDWIQNSVFEGQLTKAEVREVKSRLESVASAESGDSIVIYELGSSDYMEKTVIGEEKGSSDRII
jgi:CRISPR-associated protein Cas2